MINDVLTVMIIYFWMATLWAVLLGWFTRKLPTMLYPYMAITFSTLALSAQWTKMIWKAMQ